MADNWINHGLTEYPSINIAKVEEAYNAKFVCELPTRTSTGEWTILPLQIYYVEKPANPDYSNYFALRVDNNRRVMISDGSSVVDILINGVKIKNSGEIIYSRSRYDYRSAETAPVAVDGGLDYFRVVGDPSLFEGVTLTIVNGEMVVVEPTKPSTSSTSHFNALKSTLQKA